MFDIVAHEILEQVAAADTSAEISELIARFTRSIGFDFFSYGVRWPVPVTRLPVDILNNYPSGWMTYYESESFIEIDPTVALGARQSDLIRWSPALFSSAKPLWDAANDFGLRHGVAQSAWSRSGAFGLLSVAREGQEIVQREYEHLRMPLAWASNMFHARLSSLLNAKFGASRSVRLTSREREVILWTAEGKTATEISMILGLSKRTVDFHLTNAALKLGASNKTHMVVYALGLGLLTLQ